MQGILQKQDTKNTNIWSLGTIEREDDRYYNIVYIIAN